MEIANVAFLGYLAYKKLKCLKEKERKRRFWVHEMFLSKNAKGFYAEMYPKIKNDNEKFFKHFRMNQQNFYFLLNLIEKRLEKFSIRRPICAEFRLVLTIMYLAHGGSRLMYSSKFHIGLTTLKNIVYETCEVIWDELHTIFLSFPNETEFLKIAEEYFKKCGIPNCIGALDGKHINIVCPQNSGSQYYNYKGRYSIVLLAACDSNYTFTTVSIGAYGSQSDGGILSHTTFGKMLMEEKLPIPNDRELPNTSIKFPHYFIGDSAFPLKRNLMRPYPGNDLGLQKDYFNTRLSSARITIEITFHIMANRWRILLNNIHATPQHVDTMVKAIVVLHNFLKLRDTQYSEYDEKEFNASHSHGRNDEISLQSINPGRSYNRPSGNAFQLREKLCAYLNENST